MIKHCAITCVFAGAFLFCCVNGRMKRNTDYNNDGYRAPPPAILTHKQAVTSDGVFNYVFAADNGLKQGESISPDGTRTGAYQYIDPSGKTISVKYTAGKDGFRIIEGDHIPLQPKPVEPIPEYQPPEYREKLEANAGNQKYKTSIKKYNQPEEKYQKYQQEEPKHRQEQPRYEQEPRYQQDRNQQFKDPRNLYRPQQNDNLQRGYQGNQQQPQRNRAMLYDVEQRHDSNYRKYLDNGQAADGQGDANNEQPGPAHHFGGGYNFEFSG